MTADGHEDLGGLLQPTLGRQDDLSGFDKPYNPWNLVMAAFFFGPLGGGWMLANNFGRIGQRRRVVPCMLAFLGLAIVLTTILVWWSEPGVAREQARVVPWWVKRGGQALTVVAAMGVAAMQKQRYRLYEHSGGEQGPWMPRRATRWDWAWAWPGTSGSRCSSHRSSWRCRHDRSRAADLALRHHRQGAAPADHRAARAR